MQSEEPVAYQFGEFIFDIENRKLIKTNDGKEVELSNQPFNFLKLIIEKKGKTVEKNQIFKEIWEDKFIGEGRLTQLITKLRADLEDSEKKIIKNRPGFGYCIGVEVKELSAEELESFLDKIKSQKEQSPARSLEDFKSVFPDSTAEIESPTEKTPDRNDLLSPEPEQEKAEIEFDTIDKEKPKSEEVIEKPPTFQEWLRKSGVKWWFRLTVILTILSSVIFSVFSPDIKVTVFIGSISNVILVAISLIYYRIYSLRRLKNFRPFSEDTTNDLLKDEVRIATKCKDKLDWETTRDNAKDGSGIFRVGWQILLMVWIFLYTALAFKTYVALAFKIQDIYWLGAVITFFNNLNTLLLAICFYTFNTLEKGIKELKESGFWMVGLFLIIGLTVIEAVLLFNNDNVFWSVNGETINVKDEISWFFRVISGVGGAIALALFVGRLQSKFFNAATKFTVIFFSYIAIQPLFVFFEDNSLKMQVVTAIVIHIAVALKYFLFLYLFWAFESGRLLFYLVRVRQANREVEDEWQKFQIVFEKNTPENSIVS